MKRWILGMVLAAMVLAPAAVAQEYEELEHDPEYQMEMQEREMELRGREAEMEAERRMADLELEKHKMELEKYKMELQHMRRETHEGGPGALLLLGIAVVHILCAVWVYQDIRQRACGSGIWIVIALLAGLLGTLVYAVVRVGDTGNNKKKT
jgi:hypothetical protein